MLEDLLLPGDAHLTAAHMQFDLGKSAQYPKDDFRPLKLVITKIQGNRYTRNSLLPFYSERQILIFPKI